MAATHTIQFPSCRLDEGPKLAEAYVRFSLPQAPYPAPDIHDDTIYDITPLVKWRNAKIS
jgi:hypothetical protein